MVDSYGFVRFVGPQDKYLDDDSDPVWITPGMKGYVVDITSDGEQDIVNVHFDGLECPVYVEAVLLEKAFL